MRNQKGQFIKGRIIPQEWVELRLQKIRGNQWNVGKKQSQETIAKRVARLVGRKNTKEQRDNIGNGKRGKPNGHLGMKMPIETGKKISQANLGRKWNAAQKENFSKVRTGMPLSSRGKKKPWMSGEKHPNWKGGATSESEKVRKSLEAKEWRRFCLARDDYRCLDCGERGGKLNVHHIYPFAFFHRLRLAPENGITLCEECHKKTDSYLNKAKKYATINSNGYFNS